MRMTSRRTDGLRVDRLQEAWLPFFDAMCASAPASATNCGLLITAGRHRPFVRQINVCRGRSTGKEIRIGADATPQGTFGSRGRPSESIQHRLGSLHRFDRIRQSQRGTWVFHADAVYPRSDYPLDVGVLCRELGWVPVREGRFQKAEGFPRRRRMRRFSGVRLRPGFRTARVCGLSPQRSGIHAGVASSH